MNGASAIRGRPHHHAVVGDGITALAFVEAANLRAGDRLTIVGQNAAEFGRGQAYAKGTPETPWRYAYLLNSPADDIDPAFARWLADRWPEVEGTMQGRTPNWLGAAAQLVSVGDQFGVNAPREFYGTYMREKAEAALAELRRNQVTVELLEDCVEGVDAGDTNLTLTMRAGRQLRVDTVDVAPGGPSTLRISGDDGPLAVPTLFGHEPAIAEQIRAGKEIFCIGGNASMLDVLRLCQSLIPEDQLRFVVAAPDGDIPPPLVPRLPRRLANPRLSAGQTTADGFLAEVTAEIARLETAGYNMREIRAGFRAHFLMHPLHSYGLPDAEARRVPIRLRFWLRGGTRDTIADLNRLVGQGRARVMTGFVDAVEVQGNDAIVQMKDTAGNVFSHTTGFVVNCAGAGPNSRFDPLTEQMLAAGHITRCPINKGLVVGPGCQTALPGLRHLSPATTVIGDEVAAMPMYDAHMLRTFAARAGSPVPTR